MDKMIYLLIALGGYLLGSFNLAFFLAKAKGFDIRGLGSNNAGASNATVTMGLKAGAAVAVMDVAKAWAAALLAGVLFPQLPHAAIVAGVSAVLGHIFPFYLGFKGGKGFASFLGLTLAMDWRFFLGIVVVVLLITLISDYIVPGTLTTIFSFPIYLLWQKVAVVGVIIVCVASAVILAKHFVNIRRLLTGQEIGLRRALSKTDKV